jgi:putative ATP-binding cassette transporter
MHAFNRQLFERFVALFRPVISADIRGRLLTMFLVVVALKLSIVFVSAVNSYINSYFFTALVNRNTPEVILNGTIWLSLFGVLTVAGVMAAYTENFLSLRWREWFTRSLYDTYLAARRFYRLERQGTVDNPDQRIAEDVRTYTDVTLSLALVLIDAVVSLFLFTSILWDITPWLIPTAVVYAALGSVLTLLVGQRLVMLNNLQFQKEADFRYSLIRLREHSEAISLLGSEAGERHRLDHRLTSAVDNMADIIRVNRNLQFFVSLYGYLTPVVPVLIVAPLYLSNTITDFGKVTQSPVAFGFVLGAFSVLINQFGQLTTLAAVTNRLGALQESFNNPPELRTCVTLDDSTESVVRLENVTVRAHEGGDVLIRDLNLELPRGTSLVVVGTHGVGKTSLFRALAGLECRGDGRVQRPRDAMFLPQRPYTPPGTLRQLVLYTAEDRDIADSRLISALKLVQFEPLTSGAFTLEDSKPWSDVLSIGEQQQVAWARLLIEPPSFVFLDDALSALDEPLVDHLYRLLRAAGITDVTFSERASDVPPHDWVLELHAHGKWHLRQTSRGPEPLA